MSLLRRVGLGGRLLAIVLIVVTIDFLINSWLFEGARRYAVREDEAAAIAEHVVVANRLIGRSPAAERPAVARELTTERFQISWSRFRRTEPNALRLSTMHKQMLAAEPALRTMELHLRLMPISLAGDIGGSTRLQDGTFVNFRFRDHEFWSLNLGRVLAMAVPSLLLLALAWILFRFMLKPLRTLVSATSEVGAANPRPLPEAGQGEVLHLIRAFNAMQERIHQLLASGSQTLLAIAHDFRTPLARLQLRLESADIDPELLRDMSRDIDEMRGLLESLQIYVEAGRDSAPVEAIDIAVTVQTLTDDARDRGAHAVYEGPDHLEVMARPVAIRRALSNLVENALAYGGNVRMALSRHGSVVKITVEDDGPGIPEDRLQEVLRPFIRLDNARARDTAGMGLGLSIVEGVVKAEGGTLELANKALGGLRVTIRLPRTTA